MSGGSESSGPSRLAEPAAPRAVVAHVDDPRELAEFGEERDGERDGVWYLHRQSVADGAAADVRCGIFRVTPAASEFTLPYHETVVTLSGEGRTTVGGRMVEIAPGRQLFLEAGGHAAFAPTSTNHEFITVIETPHGDALAPALGIAALDGGELAPLATAAQSPAVAAGTVTLAVGEHDDEQPADRSLYVVGGAGEIELPDGTRHPLRAGTIAFLPRLQRVRWSVTAEVVAFVTAVR
ncbi:MAG TPA: hypothetical protein VLK58_22895 [Conexibacter sp.]|nr:hypothetical protein [Conexibacter sp.]